MYIKQVFVLLKKCNKYVKLKKNNLYDFKKSKEEKL